MSVFRNLSFAAVEKVVRAGVTFVVGVAVIRHLGPEGNAQLTNTIATVTVLATVAKLGVDNVAMREVANNPGDSARITLRFMLMRFVASALMSIGLLYFSDLIFPGEPPRAVVYIAIILLVVQATDLGLVWCLGLKLLHVTSMVSIAVVVASAAVKVILIANGAGYPAFIILLAVELAITAVVLNVKALWSKPPGATAPRQASAKLTSPGELSYTLAISVFTVFYFSFDAVLLPRLMPLAEAGRYLAGKSLVDGASAIGGSFAAALFPFLVAARNRSTTELDRVFGASLTLATFLGFAICGALIVGYFLVIDDLLGERFQGTGATVVWLSVGMALFFQGGIVDSRLTIERQVGFVFKKGLLAVLMKAALVFALQSYLTPSVVAATTIISAYGASLLVAYFAAPQVFRDQITSLNPMRVLPAIRVVRELR